MKISLDSVFSVPPTPDLFRTHHRISLSCLETIKLHPFAEGCSESLRLLDMLGTVLVDLFIRPSSSTSDCLPVFTASETHFTSRLPLRQLQFHVSEVDGNSHVWAGRIPAEADHPDNVYYYPDPTLLDFNFRCPWRTDFRFIRTALDTLPFANIESLIISQDSEMQIPTSGSQIFFLATAKCDTYASTMNAD